MILQESPLHDRYAARIGTLKPKIRSAVHWLTQDQNQATLLRGDLGAVNRLLIDATAFSTTSLILNDPSLQANAAAFLAEAMKRQLPDGTLRENGGFDSSYQGVSLLHGTYFALRSDNPAVKTMLDRALQPELAAVGETGVLNISRNTRTRGQELVAGHVKTPDYRSVILGLYYSGLYLGNDRAVRAAASIYTARFHLDPNAKT